MTEKKFHRITKNDGIVEAAEEEVKKQFKKELRALLVRYKSYLGHQDQDRILIHLGENNGVKGGEIIKYF